MTVSSLMLSDELTYCAHPKVPKERGIQTTTTLFIPTSHAILDKGAIQSQLFKVFFHAKVAVCFV